MVDPARHKALQAALSHLKKQYGEHAIQKLGHTAGMALAVIPTGSLALDLALGIGGVPRRHVTEIYGSAASGKTTICHHIIAEAQKLGGVCAFIDLEHSLDSLYAQKCGVDIDNLYISQPDIGEQALEITEALVRSGAIDVVVFDSVAALVPRAELEGELDSTHVDLQARLMSQALRKLVGAIKKSNTALIFTNQIRTNVGMLFGSPETTPGGNALKFYASLRMDVRQAEPLKVGQEVVGNRVKVRITKNKLGTPFKEAQFDIMYDEGISSVGDMLDTATSLAVVEKRGACYMYGSLDLGQGRENAKAFLQAHPELAGEIDTRIRQHYVVPTSVRPPSARNPSLE